MSITGQFVNADSIVNINVGTLLPDASLSRIKNAGLLEGTWKGEFDFTSGSVTTTIKLDSSGKIMPGEDNKAVRGHIFQKDGSIVGFKSGDETDCWAEAQFLGTYSGDAVAGTARSGCTNIAPVHFNLVYESSKVANISAGGLSVALTSEEKESALRLKITGTIDARDFKTIRDEMPELSSIDLSEVTIAGYNGTGGTYGTESYNYPANSIPRNAFYKQDGNSILKSIQLPASLTQISRSAFNNCKSLISVEIPSSVTDIALSSFTNCIQLSSLKFRYPSSLVSIGNFAFANCAQLNQGVDITPNIVSIGDYAFIGSSISVTVNELNQNYSSFNGALYDKNKTLLFYVPPTTKGLMEIPATVGSIAIDAFYNCSGLTGISIPNSVKKFGDWAFENCSGLTTVTIPASVDSIGKMAFQNCTGLISVYTEDSVPINLTASDSVFKNVDKENCVLWVPTGTKTAYMNANQWMDFKRITEYELTEIQGINKDVDFNVYPNPTTGKVNFKSSDNSVIRIYTPSGILINSLKAGGSLKSFDISSFPSGIYLIKQQNKSGIRTIKLLKH